MPGKNEVKQYLENSYYHIYNRGVEKRNVFQDQQDYAVFLSYLKEYLLPKNQDQLAQKLSDLKLPYREKARILKLLRLNNFAGEITLIAYCLMTNHFHLLVKQKSRESIDKFMNSQGTRYGMYFNRKYQRVGPLYEGPYKAVLVQTEEQLLHLTRYIHQNPLKLKTASQGHPLQAQPSSYPEYMGKRKTAWVDPSEILAFFSKTSPQLSYEAFMGIEENLENIEKLAIDT